jgi:hypothetical protein
MVVQDLPPHMHQLGHFLCNSSALSTDYRKKNLQNSTRITACEGRYNGNLQTTQIERG